ncbi:hypothetical protein [Candidatus Leptofilum sp.]|uniref:hypothetical protein n=1 Tax=Candidatus Leptofilum sp. TaxID=3241576 RepID=UPI003B5BEC00
MQTDKLTQFSKWLFWLNAAVWLGFAIWTMTGFFNNGARDALTFLIIGILMLGNAAVFLWCGWAVQKQANWYRFAVLTVLLVNIILTIPDQFGFFDFLILLLDFILLALVLILFRQYGLHWL